VKSTSCIVVFDSGIGGLTVLAECRKLLKSENFVYYGDNIHAPYGNKSVGEIRRLVFEVFDKLSNLPIKAAVLGCNTATALCAETLREKYPFPVVGAEPAVLPAARNGGEVLVLSTAATAQSPRFLSLVERAKSLYPQSRVRVEPCKELAGAIERRLLDPSFDCTPYLPNVRPSSVVLGCTHYIFVKEQIQAFYGVPVYDGNAGIASRLQVVLRERGVVGNGCSVGEISFLGEAKNTNKNLFEHMFAL